MNRREQFKSETQQCRAEGCNGEVFFKVFEGENRRQAGGNRTPLSPVNGEHPPQLRRPFPEGSRILSSFCKKHTCSLFVTEEGCGFKKPIHDTVCALHTKCPIHGCTKAKSQYLDPSNDPAAVPKYLRHDFCPDHKCAVAKCPRRRALEQVPRPGELLDSRQQQSRFITVCQQHQCKATGCLEQSQEGRNCCRGHECKTPDCRTIVEEGYPFCAIHIKCTVGNCGRARYLPKGSKEYLPGCEQHATCAAAGCSKLRFVGSVFCLTHTCQERNCDKLDVTEGVYCPEHRCDYDSCRNSKAWREGRARGKYCAMHSCRGEKCNESVGALALFCENHECSEERCLARVLHERLCVDHFKALYMVKGREEMSSRLEPARLQLSSERSRIMGNRDHTDEGHHGTNVNLQSNANHGRFKTAGSATMSPHSEWDHEEDDEKESVRTGNRLSHAEETVDGW